MKHPDEFGETITASYTGETVGGVPWGMGEFKSDERTGWGMFENGQLHGMAVIIIEEEERERYVSDYCQGVEIFSKN